VLALFGVAAFVFFILVLCYLGVVSAVYTAEHAPAPVAAALFLLALSALVISETRG
jgi:hypothetical protein